MNFATWLLTENHQATFQKLIDEIYQNVVANKSWNHSDLQDNFYHYLTAGWQGLGYRQYRRNNLTPQDQQKYQAIYQQIKSGWQWDESAWSYTDGGAWESFHRNGVKGNASQNLKRYVTLKSPKSEEMKKLPVLLQQLSAVPSVFSVKYPVNVGLLIGGVDNLVIYFTDRADVQKIDAAVQASGIQEEDRSQFYRRNYGVDQVNTQTGKKESDTEIASRFFKDEFRKWLNQVVPQTNATVLTQLRQLQPDQAKKEIGVALDIILKKRSPHRLV